MTTPLTALTWKHFPAGPNGFFRAPFWSPGATEAVLIDGGFTLSDGRALADASRPREEAHHHLCQPVRPRLLLQPRTDQGGFPRGSGDRARRRWRPSTRSVEKKLAVWGPQLKENGPQTLADVVIPEAFDGKTLTSMARPSRSSMPKASSTGAICACRRSRRCSAAC